MKKVIFFIESLEGGGAEKSLTELVENLNKSDFDITVVTESDNEVYTQRVRSVCNLRCLTKKCDRQNHLRYNWNRIVFRLINTAPKKLVHRLLIGNRFDVEIAYCEGLATKLIAASGNNKSKKIAFVHTDMQTNHWSKIHFDNLESERNAYNRFDVISCVSKTAETAFVKTFGLADKTTVCYNPIDFALIQLRAKEFTEMPAYEGLRMITLGRLTAVKAFDRLLRIASILKEEGRKFELIILGKGEKEPELKQYVVENDLGDCVKLLGFQLNPYKYIAVSDFFVCSSLAEGFSTAAAECVMLGKPVITTDCSGMVELFGGYECGIISKNSEEALLAALKSIFNNPGCLSKYIENSKLRAEHFELDKSIRAIEALMR